MASGPEETEPVNYQTWVLKISIHCEGCKKKIKKILHKVKGVYSIEIDAQQNRATVTGNVDPESLLQKLLKYGKHAEISPEKNPATTNSSSSAVKTEAKGNEKAKSAASTGVSASETEEKKKAENEKGKAAESPESSPATDVTAPKPETDATSQPEKSISGKEVKREENKPDEQEVNPPPAIPSPANIQPVYTTVSYHAVNPSTSYAYYAEPPPEIPSSYAYHGNLPPPPPEYSPPAGSSPDYYYYSSESYYRSLDQPSSSAGSYDMFNDENPNACKLM